jgi:hypothetical protein
MNVTAIENHDHQYHKGSEMEKNTKDSVHFVIKVISKVLLTLLGVVLFIFLFWNPQNSTIIVIAGFGCLLLANIDSIKLFKAGATGVEAQMRDLVVEAEGKIEHLRELATLMAEMTLSLMKRAHRWKGYEYHEEKIITKRIEDLLNNLKVDEEERNLIFKEFHQWEILDYAFWALGNALKPQDIKRDQQREFDELKDRGIHNPASPDQIESFYSKAGLLTPERKEILEDYRYYLKHFEHRRPDVWANKLRKNS